MASKIFAGSVVAFWVVMMAALVRVEFFPHPVTLDTVPAEQVMHRIFDAPEQRLNVFYQGQDIGNCSVEVTPMILKSGDTNDAQVVVRPRKVYQVRSSVHLKLSVFGIPSHLRMVGNTQFNARYAVEEFNIRTTLGDGHIDLQGDDQSNKVKMVIEMGDVREKREFGFNQIRGAGLANVLGIPGLSNLGFLGGGSSGAGRSGHGSSTPEFEPKTTTALTDFKIGDVVQRAYLLETKLDDRVWAKMWVDMSGAILRVETSIGLEMLANTIGAPQMSVSKRRVGASPKTTTQSDDPHRKSD